MNRSAWAVVSLKVTCRTRNLCPTFSRFFLMIGKNNLNSKWKSVSTQFFQTFTRPYRFKKLCRFDRALLRLQPGKNALAMCSPILRDTYCSRLRKCLSCCFARNLKKNCRSQPVLYWMVSFSVFPIPWNYYFNFIKRVWIQLHHLSNESENPQCNNAASWSCKYFHFDTEWGKSRPKPRF